MSTTTETGTIRDQSVDLKYLQKPDLRRQILDMAEKEPTKPMRDDEGRERPFTHEEKIAIAQALVSDVGQRPIQKFCTEAVHDEIADLKGAELNWIIDVVADVDMDAYEVGSTGSRGRHLIREDLKRLHTYMANNL